jgi:murein DD-endopeptidase MepM/ murein hydrolase activator NlpD
VANPWDHAHEALDFACLPGAAVFAVTEGEIDSVGRVVVRGEGRFRVWLAVEGAPLRVEYANLASASVSPGDAVSPGEPIGESALGLHLAIWSEDEGRYVDPGDYLPLESMADAP